jgi:outer membrane protein
MNRLFTWIVFFMLIVAVAGNVYLYVRMPKIAYVRSSDLIEKFAGTQEARAELQKKKNVMIANVDTLHSQFEKERLAYMKVAPSLSANERKNREEVLGKQQKHIVQYEEAVDGQITEQDEKMMGAVLTQINSFVEQYAKEKDFDIIMGTTLSGSLLYGKESMDVTDDILIKLNAKYKGH